MEARALESRVSCCVLARVPFPLVSCASTGSGSFTAVKPSPTGRHQRARSQPGKRFPAPARPLGHLRRRRPPQWQQLVAASIQRPSGAAGGRARRRDARRRAPALKARAATRRWRSRSRRRAAPPTPSQDAAHQGGQARGGGQVAARVLDPRQHRKGRRGAQGGAAARARAHIAAAHQPLRRRRPG